MTELKIKELRLVVTNKCGYSCSYCNLYYKKLLESKKISKKEFNNQYKIGNESYGLLFNKDQERKPLTPADYKFLFLVLKEKFFLEDITFTGGDPFLNTSIKSIVNLAVDCNFRTTAITKGSPLFSIKSKADAYKKFGKLSRIIVSIDSLSPLEHAKNNLPLMKESLAVNFLPQTLKTIKTLTNLGYNLEVNSVIKPFKASGEDILESFNKTKDIIDFCFDAGVSKVKFIELDSIYTIGKPYIESYFKKMIEAGVFSEYNSSPWKNKKLNKITNSSVTEIYSILKNEKRKSEMKVLAYRTHCPSSFLTNGEIKTCKFSLGGELHLDFNGRSFLCQKDDSFKFVDTYEAIKNRDVALLVKKINLINKRVEEQKCKI
jgi:molybdenum cofactor biosynthesis enzyme MoaA